MAATIRLSQQHSCSLDHLVGEREQLVHVLLTELCLDTQSDSQKVPADISSRRSEIAALCSQWEPRVSLTKFSDHRHLLLRGDETLNLPLGEPDLFHRGHTLRPLRARCERPC